ncbi:MAG: hypothetical protein ABSB76_09940 [Streptosporangiaceae bacterium]
MIWYSQVLPTAMGNEIELAGTNAFELVVGVAAGVALTLDAALPDEVLLDTGAELLAEVLHPARATTADTARTALADPNLLI